MQSVNIHASCVMLDRAGVVFGAPPGAGVLLLGESGAGKSDLALRLIERGAQLVADDRCELFLRDERLWARPPAALAGLIELRGVGIIALQHAAEAPVQLAVRLVASDKVARLPPPDRYMPPEQFRLAPQNCPPLIALAAREASSPAKIAAAIAELFRD